MSDDTPRWTISRRAAEIAFALITLGFGLVIIFGARELDTGWSRSGPEAGYFPYRIGILLAVASLLVLIRSVRVREPSEPFLTDKTIGRLALFALPLVALIALIPPLGIYLVLVLYIPVAIGLIGRAGWSVTLVLAAAVPVVMFVVFEFLFKVPLPKGPLGPLLGML